MVPGAEMRTETDHRLVLTGELCGGGEKGLDVIVVVVTQLCVFTKNY